MTSPEPAAAVAPEVNPPAERCLGAWWDGSRGLVLVA